MKMTLMLEPRWYNYFDGWRFRLLFWDSWLHATKLKCQISHAQGGKVWLYVLVKCCHSLLGLDNGRLLSAKCLATKPLERKWMFVLIFVNYKAEKEQGTLGFFLHASWERNNQGQTEAVCSCEEKQRMQTWVWEENQVGGARSHLKAEKQARRSFFQLCHFPRDCICFHSFRYKLGWMISVSVCLALRVWCSLSIIKCLQEYPSDYPPLNLSKD